MRGKLTHCYFVFRYVRDPPPLATPPAPTVSLRRSRSTLSHGVTLNTTTSGPRLFIVVLGGATYTELRHLYEQSRQTSRQIIMVSTHFMNARKYLNALSKITPD